MTVLMPTAAAPETWASATWPLGAHWDGTSAATFAVHAPAATQVVLEIYPGATGLAHLAAFPLAQGPDGVWRGQVTQVGPGVHYGFRAWGPNWPVDEAWQRGGSAAGFISDVDDAGNRFNPNKVLFDPYGLELSHTLLSPLIALAGEDGGIFGTGSGDYRGRPRREADTATVAPKSILVADTTPTGTRPGLPAEDAIVYEAHVRGLTQHPSSAHLADLLSSTPGMPALQNVPDDLRGTYAGAAYVAPYLKAIGVTTVELLPVHEANCQPGSSDTNYWCYMTLSFFAPNRAYAADQTPGGPTREFKQMVKAFHDVGLEVYLDVVYNHTGEGGQWGNDRETVGFTSLGGFATPDYYVLTNDNRLIDGATGTSNQMNLSSPAAQRLVRDSLIHWADVMGVDGFRFDLAPVLGRKPADAPREDWGDQRRFFGDHPLLVGIRDLAAARNLEVIAEPWDLWGYEVGNFPDGWAEWNGRYRDAVRAFTKGDGDLGTFCDMVNGDFRDYADQGGPQRSINFVTAHDGFTMMDLVSYNGKSNGANPPFGPSDGGSDDNLSWDSGGDQSLRRQRLRNLWAILMTSRGVPMIVAGDEWGRTQNGNNNPWNIDTVGIWLNWAQAASSAPHTLPVDPSDPSLPGYHDDFGAAATPVNPVLHFAASMTALRHRRGSLRQRSYGDAEVGGDDVSYLFAAPDGSAPGPRGRSVRVLIDAPAELGGALLVLVTMDATPVTHALPDSPSGAWYRIADTAAAFEAQGNAWWGSAATAVSGSYVAAAWSVVILAAVP